MIKIKSKEILFYAKFLTLIVCIKTRLLQEKIDVEIQIAIFSSMLIRHKEPVAKKSTDYLVNSRQLLELFLLTQPG